MIGMPVVPGHERRRRVAARQILSRDVQPPVRLTSDGIDNLIVMLLQFHHLQVAAHLDVSEEPEARIPGRGFIDANHSLGFLVVRSHTVAHQPVGHGHALEHVHVQVQILLFQKGVGSVEPEGPEPTMATWRGRSRLPMGKRFRVIIPTVPTGI